MAGGHVIGPELQPDAPPLASYLAFRKLAGGFIQDHDALETQKRIPEHAHTSPRGHSFCVCPGWFPRGTDPDTWASHPPLTFLIPPLFLVTSPDQLAAD